MKWSDLMGDLVDVQPAFAALAAVSDEIVGAEERAFAVHKLRQCIAQLRGTASHLEKALNTRERVPGVGEVADSGGLTARPYVTIGPFRNEAEARKCLRSLSSWMEGCEEDEGLVEVGIDVRTLGCA